MNEFRWRLHRRLWCLVHSHRSMFRRLLMEFLLQIWPWHITWPRPLLPLAPHCGDPPPPSRKRHQRHTLSQSHVGEVDSPPPCPALESAIDAAPSIGGRSAILARPGIAIRDVHRVNVNVQKILRQDRPERAGEEPPGRVSEHLCLLLSFSTKPKKINDENRRYTIDRSRRPAKLHQQAKEHTLDLSPLLIYHLLLLHVELLGIPTPFRGWLLPMRPCQGTMHAVSYELCRAVGSSL